MEITSTLTYFNILLLECRSVLSPAQWGTKSERVKSMTAFNLQMFSQFQCSISFPYPLKNIKTDIFRCLQGIWKRKIIITFIITNGNSSSQDVFI